MRKTDLLKPRAFALVATLMIIVVLTILVTAFTVAMRTERSASHNFSERERAQAVANGMLHRIFADYAAPVPQPPSAPPSLSGGRLRPFAVDPLTKLPDQPSLETYRADPTNASNQPLLKQIFSMAPSPSTISTTNHLARLSRPATGTPSLAYSPKYWAYARQQQEPTFYPADQGGPTAPAWVDYFGADGKKIGQVAYAIWDESGKFDVNMAGPDGISPSDGSVIKGRINGLAPHDLKFEYLFDDFSSALTNLDGVDKTRQRSNFSLRKIVTASQLAASGNKDVPNTGDDRSYFSVEGLLAQNSTGNSFITPARAIDATTFSRDFEVRPEWDGDRTPLNAQKYLKSYVNNPNLFALFSNSSKVSGTYQLVSDLDPNPTKALSENLLEAALIKEKVITGPNDLNHDAWMNVMRLLAILRTSLPPYKPYGQGTPTSYDMLSTPTPTWLDQDIYAIALNILQAGAPADDENLAAYDKLQYGIRSISDPAIRFGVRLSPYLIETAISALRLPAATGKDDQVLVTEYLKFWNPYPVSFARNTATPSQPITYVYGGSWGGGLWPGHSGISSIIRGLSDYYDLPMSSGSPFTMTGPGPRPTTGTFSVVAHSRQINLAKGHDLVLYSHPWMYNQHYYSNHTVNITTATTEESVGFIFTGGPYTEQNTGSGGPLNMDLQFFIPAVDMDVNGKKNWYSFQIDDPRMGLYPRYTPTPAVQNNENNTTTNATVWTGVRDPENGKTPKTDPDAANGINHTSMTYSWKAYYGHQALYDSLTGYIDSTTYNGKKADTYGNGFNANFGDNFSASFTGSYAQKLKRAMATFALPGRPFTNLGELASVYVNRPWQTLSVATDPKLSQILDYYTTIGTTTNPAVDKNLYFQGAAGDPGSSTANTMGIQTRQQDNIWLFESTAAAATATSSGPAAPTGNLRPIRGRVNLNTASHDTLMRLICGQDSNSKSSEPLSGYTLVGSLGNGASVNGANAGVNDRTNVTITASDASAIADTIVAVRTKVPFRSLADLVTGGADGKGILTDSVNTVFKDLFNKYDSAGNFVGYLGDAVLGRLTQFGTVRQQTYTVDMVARATKTTPSGVAVPTGEVRMQAHVYFDTFSRKAFIESIEYR